MTNNEPASQRITTPRSGSSATCRRRLRSVGAIALTGAVLLLSGCSGHSGAPAVETSRTQPFSARLEAAGPTPSKSAQMICAKEAQVEIAASLDITPTRVTTPTWHDHLYSCTYEYPNGAVTLSVKELTSLATTASYFDSLEHSLGTAEPLYGLGQGAFIATHGDAVVRKDYKVLLVDVHALPANFLPLMRPSDVAQSITTVIMGCWTGA